MPQIQITNDKIYVSPHSTTLHINKKEKKVFTKQHQSGSHQKKNLIKVRV